MLSKDKKVSVIAMARGKKRGRSSLPARAVFALILSFIVIMAVAFAARFAQKQVAVPLQNAGYHVSQGKALYGKGDVRGAISEFEKATKLDPKNFTAKKELALCYQVAGELQKSIMTYNSAIKLNPKSGELYRNLSSLEFRSGNLQRAKDILTKAVKIDPNSSSGHAGLGDLSIAQGNFLEAARQYKEALSGAGTSQYKAVLLNLLGLSYANMGRKTQAVATFKRALALDPANESAKGNLKVYR